MVNSEMQLDWPIEAIIRLCLSRLNPREELETSFLPPRSASLSGKDMEGLSLNSNLVNQTSHRARARNWQRRAF